MRFVDSRCIHCGATLRVAGDATHVCCQYCNSELHVLHDGSRATTELVRAMHEGLSQKLDVLRVQNDLERLDREWNMERENYMVTAKNGNRSVPSTMGSAAIGIFMAIAGIAWTVFAVSNGAPGFFAFFGVVFVAIAVISSIGGFFKASAHDTAEQRYRHSRDRLTRELAQVEQAARSVRK